MKLLPTLPSLLLLAIGAVPSAATLQTAPGSTGELDDLLARARRGHGLEALAALTRPLEVEGPATPWGTSGWHTFSFGPGGEFRETVRGPLASDLVFDGGEVWVRHGLAAPVRTHFGEYESQVLMGWVRSGFWLRPDCPLERFEVDAPAEMPAIGIALPDGSVRGRVELDPEHHRVQRLVLDLESGSVTTTFSDYRESFGVAIPRRVAVEMQGREEVAYRVVQVGLAPPSAPPLGREALGRTVEDASFDASLPADVEIETIATGHTLARVEVQGVEIGWFLFDTGAGATAITPEAAATLGLEPIGLGPLAGIGPEVTETPLYRCDRLRIGPMTLDGVNLIEFDMHGTWGMLPDKIAGVIGWDVLSRAVCELDPLGERLRLFPPDHEPAVDFHPLTLYGRLPHVHADYEGDRRGIFALDTGAPAIGVHFNGPTVRHLDLLNGRDTSSGSMMGAGGRANFEMGEIQWLVLAGQHMQPVGALFSTDPGTPLADPAVHGAIGGQVMAPFHLVLDYPRGRIAFVPKEPGSPGDG